MDKCIAVIGTLDTKGPETLFVRKKIEEAGFDSIVMDPGLRGIPFFQPEITRHSILSTAGYNSESIAELHKSEALEVMVSGMIEIVRNLIKDNAVQGIIGIGGSQGSLLSAGVMKKLPFGFPKVIVSAVANGNNTFGPLVGTKDITIIHSVADILGLNSFTRKVLLEGVGAVTGMLTVNQNSLPEPEMRVGMTTAGVTTKCALSVKDYLEKKNVEVISFHCNGIGAQAMEELASEGKFNGIIDMSPKDIGDSLFGGLFTAYPGRLINLKKTAIPLLLVPGTLDFILYGNYNELSPSLKRRKLLRHNARHTHVRTSFEEMILIAEDIASRLDNWPAECRILIPEKGFSETGKVGGLINDPHSDSGFYEGLRKYLDKNPNPNLKIKKVPLGIDEEEFAVQICHEVLNLITES